MNAPITTTAHTTNAHIKPQLLISGTFVTTDIKRGHKPGEKLAGQPYWVLEARQVPEVIVPQEMLNHWGVFVTSQAAVDDAFEKVSARQKDFGLGRVQKPRFRHGSYAFYFVEGDSNWWEVEYRTPELLYTTLREK